MMIANSGAGKTCFGRPIVISTAGLPPTLRGLIPQAFSQLENRSYDERSQFVMPGLSALHGYIGRQGWVTVARDAITDTEAYHAAPMYQNFRRQINCDDYVTMLYKHFEVSSRAELLAYFIRRAPMLRAKRVPAKRRASHSSKRV